MRRGEARGEARRGMLASARHGAGAWRGTARRLLASARGAACSHRRGADPARIGG